MVSKEKMGPSSLGIYHTKNSKNGLEVRKLQPPDIRGIVFTKILD
jgi:hypothetical protein